MSGFPQRPRGEPAQVQLPAAQQGRLRQDGPTEDGGAEDGQGAAQGNPAGGRRQGGGPAARRGYHHSKHPEVSALGGGELTLLNLLFLLLSPISWGSGANPWGPEKEDQFSKPNHWDGMLEVVGVTGVVHLGQIQSGLRSAMRIAQVSS